MLHLSPWRSRAGLAFIVAFALLGGRQADAALICLPCWSPWLFGAFTLTRLDTCSTEPTPGEEEYPLPECIIEPAPLTVLVKPLWSQVAPGDTFDVAISADISKAVVSFGFHVSYDTMFLALDGLQLAPTFRPMRSNRADGLAALAYPNVAVGEGVLLATARFRALAPGTGSIGIEISPGDKTEGFALRGCGFAQPTITLARVTIIPEPATILLLLSGLGLLRRRVR